MVFIVYLAEFIGYPLSHSNFLIIQNTLGILLTILVIWRAYTVFARVKKTKRKGVMPFSVFCFFFFCFLCVCDRYKASIIWLDQWLTSHRLLHLGVILSESAQDLPAYLALFACCLAQKSSFSSSSSDQAELSC